MQVDVDNLESVKRVLQGAAIVVHTAGPFQRKDQSLVLEAAIATRYPPPSSPEYLVNTDISPQHIP